MDSGPTGTHPIFRRIPPWTTILEIFHILGISTEFPSRFTKYDIRHGTEEVEEAIALLYPYYIPCKAKQFFSDITDTRWITILRHCLTPHGYTLSKKETTSQKQKRIIYTIERSTSDLSEGVCVDFS